MVTPTDNAPADTLPAPSAEDRPPPGERETFFVDPEYFACVRISWHWVFLVVLHLVLTMGWAVFDFVRHYHLAATLGWFFPLSGLYPALLTVVGVGYVVWLQVYFCRCRRAARLSLDADGLALSDGLTVRAIDYDDIEAIRYAEKPQGGIVTIKLLLQDGDSLPLRQWENLEGILARLEQHLPPERFEVETPWNPWLILALGMGAITVIAIVLFPLVDINVRPLMAMLVFVMAASCVWYRPCSCELPRCAWVDIGAGLLLALCGFVLLVI